MQNSNLEEGIEIARELMEEGDRLANEYKEWFAKISQLRAYEEAYRRSCMDCMPDTEGKSSHELMVGPYSRIRYFLEAQRCWGNLIQTPKNGGYHITVLTLKEHSDGHFEVVPQTLKIPKDGG